MLLDEFSACWQGLPVTGLKAPSLPKPWWSCDQLPGMKLPRLCQVTELCLVPGFRNIICRDKCCYLVHGLGIRRVAQASGLASGSRSRPRALSASPARYAFHHDL